MLPLIGITCDIAVPDPALPERLRVYSPVAYQDAVVRAGGVPVLLSPQAQLVDAYLEMLDGVVLTGGDDVDLRTLGGELHPKAKVMHPRRQAFELALLAGIDRRRMVAAGAAGGSAATVAEIPTLGICLGMQLMAVHHGGAAALIQHLSDEPGHDEQSAARHSKDYEHGVVPLRRGDGSAGPARHAISPGRVASWHHQAVRSGVPLGPMVVTMTADDGTIEAIEDPGRGFYVGVQWHPERTSDARVGLAVIRKLVDAAAMRKLSGGSGGQKKNGP